ncbi:hypothetical protein OAG26_00950 [Flavobacteriales bacterium]|nr:hypothetical protein [Flavobacteriales bacterium]
MALNLSRNTKVFVSSVNGVGATGGVKTCHVSTAGTGYAVGDIVTLGTTSSNGTGFKCIVKTITGGSSTGPVASIMVPNNFRGAAFAVDETATESAVQNYAGTDNSGASGLIVTVDSIAATTTADGGRIGTGKFKGNEVDANTFRVGVLDGYSFSQGSDSSDVTISEAGAAPNRGSKRFNDSLPPAEWSFGTYVRPFVHGSASFRTALDHDCVENILWAAISGTALPGDATADGRGVVVGTTAQNGSQCTFAKSDVHELMKLNLFFALENTTYRLNDAQVNQAEIDFSIDGIASITWSGNATTIDQVGEAIEDPSKFIIQTTAEQAPTSANTDTYVETYNYVDTTGPSDADYLRNKLSTLYLDADAQGGGSASNGLDDRTYDINITGGSLTIANNVTYVTPETIGIVDKPIGSFTGARVISGSLTMYLDTKSNGSNQLLTDMAGATDLVTNVFDMRLFMGVAGAVGSDGDAIGADDFTAPGVEFNMPRAQLSIPTIEVGDLVSASLEFAAHGSDLLTGDEITVKYLGSTSHTQAGYLATGATALDA